MPARTIFIQFIGFLLQTLPIVVLWPVPFHDDALSLSRKKMTLSLIGYTVLLSAGFALMSWLIYVPSPEHNTFVRTASNIYMLICILLSIGFFFIMIRSSFMKKLIVIVILLHYATALFTLTCIILGMLTAGRPGDLGVLIIYERYELLINIGLLAVTFPLVYLFLNGKSSLASPIWKTARSSADVSICYFRCCCSLSVSFP